MSNALDLFRHPGVGFSDKRSPVKHYIQRKHVGRDVGAAPHVANRWAVLNSYWRHSGHLIVDLTAGDAVGDGVNPWKHGSSPTIFANIAATQPNIRVRLYERKVAIYERQIENLTLFMHDVGFDDCTAADGVAWCHSLTGSTVTSLCADARTETFADLRPGEWLYVSNDPNNMAGWCLNMAAFLRAIEERPAIFMSTMGCNSGGLKRLDFDQRVVWFDHVKQAECVVQSHNRLDLLLFSILRDDAQWAYLLLTPKRWKRGTVEAVTADFQKQGLSVDTRAFSESAEAFHEQCDRLFLTTAERSLLE